MKQILFYTSLLTFALSSCKLKSKETQTTPSSKQASTQSTNCSAKISFGSPGTGIDGKTYEAVKEFLKAKTIKYTEARKGREGETEMCLDLSKLNSTEQSALIKELKDLASKGQYVNVN
ncbi:MAG: hypothetical protein JSU07_06630 [Bacteroidetes bacterium]|nr:hypothetical protein [Bacteroidota bacterium]